MVHERDGPWSPLRRAQIANFRDPAAGTEIFSTRYSDTRVPSVIPSLIRPPKFRRLPGYLILPTLFLCFVSREILSRRIALESRERERKDRGERTRVHTINPYTGARFFRGVVALSGDISRRLRALVSSAVVTL